MSCPNCAMPSERVHSTYERHLADGPVGDRAVRIDLSVRRLYCENFALDDRVVADFQHPRCGLPCGGGTRQWLSRRTRGARPGPSG
ncbi:transposase family protein [Streptomyces lasiicapitis]|uniref:transposase family protein n=1 Tax=Streptomyces lasiicapitis TaxID=1923961 RepID=UPI00369D8C7C